MASMIFIIDTCAHMNCHITSGLSYIDIARASIESYIKFKIRESSNGRNTNRLLLVYYDYILQKPCVVGLDDKIDKLLEIIKCISCHGITKLDICLQKTFEVINRTRLTSGIESFTFGRKPTYIEPCGIVFITYDGNPFTLENNEMKFDINPIFIGSELYKDPYRWDEKIFGICLTEPSTINNDELIYSNLYEDSELDKLCKKSLGTITRCCHVKSCVSELNHIIDISSQPYLAINIIKLNSEDKSFNNDNIFHSLIHVPLSKTSKFINWPIPETYKIDEIVDKIPSRDAIPNIYILLEKSDKYPIGTVMADVYMIGNERLLDMFSLIYTDKEYSFFCYILNENCNNITNEKPFGYISFDIKKRIAHLHILCIGFSTLASLIDNLKFYPNKQPNHEWIAEFHSFLRTIPSYYTKPIETMFKLLYLPSVIFENAYNPPVSETIYNYMNQVLEQSRIFVDDISGSTDSFLSSSSTNITNVPPVIQENCHLEDEKILYNYVPDNISSPKIIDFINQLSNIPPFCMKNTFNYVIPQPFTNPYDVDIKNLSKQIDDMTQNLKNYSRKQYQKKIDYQSNHNLPISIMGDYQSRVKEVDPDKLLDPSSFRVNTFGNPFKNRQNREFSANEADINDISTIENDNIHDNFYQIKLEKRRNTYKIVDLSLLEDSFTFITSINSNFSITTHSCKQKLPHISLQERLLTLKPPFSDYLNECFDMLRQFNPDVQILKRYEDILTDHAPRILYSLFTSIRNEAELLNCNQFISYIDNKLSTLNINS